MKAYNIKLALKELYRDSSEFRGTVAVISLTLIYMWPVIVFNNGYTSNAPWWAAASLGAVTSVLAAMITQFFIIAVVKNLIAWVKNLDKRGDEIKTEMFNTLQQPADEEVVPDRASQLRQQISTAAHYKGVKQKPKLAKGWKA